MVSLLPESYLKANFSHPMQRCFNINIVSYMEQVFPNCVSMRSLLATGQPSLVVFILYFVVAFSRPLRLVTVIRTHIGVQS